MMPMMMLICCVFVVRMDGAGALNTGQRGSSSEAGDPSPITLTFVASRNLPFAHAHRSTQPTLEKNENENDKAQAKEETRTHPARKIFPSRYDVVVRPSARTNFLPGLVDLVSRRGDLNNDSLPILAAGQLQIRKYVSQMEDTVVVRSSRPLGRGS
jgi:hypothetical protein